ncbi:hypothetical protein [Croceicoccus sp. Ery15]|uniref:hypothetical protein n=1 Tax=Croceicoccus sp. Ery15 TaxID=1703338 RepID=UPI001E2972A5|nr:hypothetical protein [Croceicoccus sp. Ery15]
MAKPDAMRRGEIVSRTILGIFGSYALASACLLAVVRLWPDGGRTATSLGEMIGFILFGAAAIAAFSMRSATRAWMLIGGASGVLLVAAFAFGKAGGGA